MLKANAEAQKTETMCQSANNTRFLHHVAIVAHHSLLLHGRYGIDTRPNYMH
jgi:hypothetical protein